MQREEAVVSVRQQCRLLSLPRSTLYYQPQDVSPEELGLMRLIDEEFLKHPFYGRRLMTEALCRRGHHVNHKRVQRLMRVMGLESVAPSPP